MWAFLSPFLTNPTVIKWTVIILSVLGLWLYIGHLRAENARLIQDNATLQVAVAQQQAAIVQLQKDHEAIIKAKDDLAADIEKLRKSSEDLKNQLYRNDSKKKSLEQLARKKSKLVEDAINKGTEKVFKCFELISENGKC